MKKQLKRKCIVYGLGIIVYAGAVWGAARFMLSDQEKFAIFLGTYLLTGYGAFQKLSEEIMEKRFPVEYILVIFATIGAFGIGKYMEAVIVMLMFELGMLAEQIATDRTKRSIAKMIDLRPTYAIRKVKGQEVQVDPSELKMSHIIVIKPGERIPVDAVVLAGSSTIDTKAITGEAMPVEVYKGDKIYSGCINQSGVLEARVTRIYKDSIVSRIMETVEEAQNRKSQKEAFVTRFSKVYAPIMVLLSVLIMVIPPSTFSYGNWETWIYKGLIFIIVACPCALAVAAPLAFLGGIASAARQGIVVKGGNFLESLVKADTFIFDKTGTLTQGVFEVSAVHHNEMEEKKLLEYAALAECASSHPISKSLQKAYGKEIDRSRVSDIKEISGHGIIAKVDGHEVAAGNSKLMKQIGVDYYDCHSVGTIIHMAIDGEYAGHIVISDILKPHSKEVIAELKKAGVEKTVMLTGDAKRVADQVAQSLGIDEVYSELLPADKVLKVEELLSTKAEKDKLAFVGDGINDAPVLTRADIGIAMGAMGSDAAIEAADVVLMDDDPLKISKAIKISRKCLRIVYQNIIFALVIKFACLGLGAIGIANMWFAIFADVGVMIIAILNAIRALRVHNL